MRLLIVDDHAGIRAMIREIAALPDPDVRECDSGETAIRLVREFCPDVVTMDARMPGIGGLDATREIKSAAPGVVVFVVSAHNQPSMRDAAIEAGATGFIAKDNLADLQPIFALFRNS